MTPGFGVVIVRVEESYATYSIRFMGSRLSLTLGRGWLAVRIHDMVVVGGRLPRTSVCTELSRPRL